MNRTDDECYDPGKVSPVDRAMPREDDFGGIMYWADEQVRCPTCGFTAAMSEIGEHMAGLCAPNLNPGD